jgi:hypothetical protein
VDAAPFLHLLEHSRPAELVHDPGEGAAVRRGIEVGEEVEAPRLRRNREGRAPCLRI